MAESIRCPKCGCELSVEEAFAEKARAEIRRELVEDLREKQALLAKREADAARREADLERRVAEQVKTAVDTATAKARTDAQAAVALDLEAAKSSVDTMRQRLAEAQKNELALRQAREKLELEKSELALTVERRLDAERKSIREKANTEVADNHALQLKEKDAQMERLKKTIDELKQKSELGSQQLQGEVLEASLEETLRREFPTDLIEPVAKGVRGGDVVQRVRIAGGVECGVILWESKRTRAWADAWLPKLRDDQRAMRAELAALVTQVLPKGAAPVGAVDGVWVSSYACYVGLAHLLRKCLIDVATAQRAQEGRHEKTAMLYDYLSGPQFRARIEGLLEPFRQMMTDLHNEKQAVLRLWARREKQLERVMQSTTGLYGDLEGIVGSTLPAIESLSLPCADEAGDAVAEDGKANARRA